MTVALMNSSLAQYSSAQFLFREVDSVEERSQKQPCSHKQENQIEQISRSLTRITTAYLLFYRIICFSYLQY